MRRIVTVLTSLLLITSPMAFAQRHDSQGKHGVRSERRDNNGRHNDKKNNNGRPGRKDATPVRGNGNRHDNGKGHSAPSAPKRPQQPSRPQRPQQPSRPQRPPVPVRPVYPGFRPGHSGRPVMRPGRPVRPRPVRPVRPSGWRPKVWVPVVRPFFGLSFGLHLSNSITLLAQGGYKVDSYDSRNVWLSDVNELGMLWPKALVSYGTGGGVVRTELMYSTLLGDMSRYNAIYNHFYGQYGMPYFVNNGGMLNATWFSRDGGYIQLEYGQREDYGGGMRFFTTLTYGN